MADRKGKVSLGIVEWLIGESRVNDFSLIVDGSDMPIASSSNEDSVYYCNKTGTSNGITFTKNKVYRCIYDSEAQSNYSYAEVGEGLLCAFEQYNCFNKISGKYRVTCFYFGANPLEVDPVFYAGTVWEKIENRMILGASSTKLAGSTGGSETVTLQMENIVNHDGHLYVNDAIVGHGSAVSKYISELSGTWGNSGRGWDDLGNEFYPTSHSTGGDANGQTVPFSILNPYKAEVMYQRLPNNTIVT